MGADIELPLLFFGKARGEGLRYVLKTGTAPPCLDIGGTGYPMFLWIVPVQILPRR